MRTDSVEFLLKAPWFPLSPVLLTDGWSSENWQDETTRCLLVRLLVHALRKKNLPQGNLSNLLSSPTNQVCHRELTTQLVWIAHPGADSVPALPPPSWLHCIQPHSFQIMLGAVCNLLKFAVILTLLEFCQNAFQGTRAGVVPDGGSGVSVGYDRSDSRQIYAVEREEKLRELNHPSSGWELSQSDAVQEGRLDEVPAIPPPSSVKLEFINISAVLVSWSYPFEDVPPPIQFLLQCSKDGRPYQNVTKLMNDTQFVFGHMLLSAYYQFRVRAYRRGVASEPSQPSYSFLNGITVPPGPPINVKSSAVSYSEIALVWDPPFPAPPTPLIYQIAWGTNPQHLNQEESVMGETHRSFQSLNPGQTYFFQIRADISGHISIPSPIVNATTMGAELPGVTITAWNTSAYWVWLSWSAPPPHRYPLVISNFTVYYREKGGRGGRGKGDMRDEFCCNLTVNSDQFEANVTDLQPETAYIFSVGYTSRGFRSDLSEEQVLMTTDSLQCYSCEPISSTKLEIKWKTSSRDTHSVVIYETVRAQQQRIASVNITGSSGAYTISGLHPWTRHAIVVMLQDSSRPAVSNCPVTDCQTKEDAPFQPPTGLQVSCISSSEATLMWTPPPFFTRNGILTDYVITYQCSSNNLWQQCSREQINVAVNSSNITTLVVKGLTPFTLYSFQIAAETAVGRSPFSDSLSCTTQQDVPAGAPRNLTAENITEKSVHLTWDPPLPQDWNGNITGYVIFYAAIDKPRSTASYKTNVLQDSLADENGSGLSEIKFLSGAVIETSIKTTTVLGMAGEIDGLRPLTSYSFSVAAKTVSGIGAISTALRVQTLKSVIHLTVEVNFSAEIISGIDSSVCFNILFTWTPLFSTNGASELLEKNVTACTWSRNVSYSRLASHGAQYRTIHVDTNSTRIILPISAYSSLLPRITYIFWLSVSAQLSNETLAHFRSIGTKLEIPSCGGDHMVAIIVPSITAASLVIAAIVVIFCLRKYLKKCQQSIVSPPSSLLASYQFEEVHNYAMAPELRRSDGRSDSSSNVESEESRSSSPTYNCQDNSSCSTTVEETSPLLDVANDRFHRAYANTSIQSSSTNLEIDYISTETQTFSQLPLDLRQDPDGCSLSSSSSV